MLKQQTFCGYCDEALPLDNPDAHMCESKSYYLEFPEYRNLSSVQLKSQFTYSTESQVLADAFLTRYPEFKEFQDLTAYRKIGLYDSIEQDDFTTVHNYDSDGFPIVTEVSLEEVTRSEEWDGIYDNRDNYQREVIGYWRDVETTRCTIATTWWHFKPGAEFATRGAYVDYPHLPKGFTANETYAQAYDALDYSEPALQALSFTELQGFAAQQLIDLNITERYNFRFFNIFYGKDSHLHCGLLTLTEDSVKCSKRGCYYNNHPLPIPVDPDRSTMEAFTHAIIRHGNNHGPDWYTNRQDFAFIHAENCDTNHNRSEGCNANVPLAPRDLNTLTGALNFLLRHRKFCRDNACRCTAYYHVVSQLTYERSAA